MRRWPSPWDASQHPARALLLFRGLYALLAFDAWMLMLEHGGRYGVGPFNVAHFDFVAWLVPMPSPALYLGLVTASGLYACSGMLGLLARMDALILCVLYTAAWALSMHDSYQHHYLLSWLLAFGVCVPRLSVADCLKLDARARTSAVPLVASCCSVVYLFTAVSKSSELWLRGAVLQKLAAHGGPMSWTPRGLMALGMAADSAWHLSAIAIVLLQLLIAVGFIASIYRDERRSRLLAFSCRAALIGAGSFHIAAELNESLAIGWFSYYMLWIAGVLLSPAAWLTELLALPAHLRARMPWSPKAAFTAGLLAALSVLLCLALALPEDLPGVGTGVCLVSGLSLARVALAYRQREGESALRSAAALATGLLALGMTLQLTTVRFDYFRRAAGELARMARVSDALELYRKAELHAPRGTTRRAKIEELERQLSEQRGE